jgi:hypothetical protein
MQVFLAFHWWRQISYSGILSLAIQSDEIFIMSLLEAPYRYFPMHVRAIRYVPVSGTYAPSTYQAIHLAD